MAPGDPSLSASDGEASRSRGNGATATPFLEIRKLCKHFGSVQALSDVDLDVYRGEVLGLLGDNGAGKSTLVKSISGVHRPSSGTIHCEGKEVSIPSPVVARSLGIETVFQDLALIPNLDAAANLFIGRELSWGPFKGLLRVMRDSAMHNDLRQSLERLDINIPSTRMQVGGFSGGQRQAIAIARAVRWKARLVILDEPTAALSVPEQRKVLSLTRQLASEGIAVIYITHNLLDALAVTDRIAVLHRGIKATELATKETNEHEIVSAIMGRTGKSS